MSGLHDVDLICRVEQFYYREARLLDDRRYADWLTLLAPEILYRMPLHFVAQSRGARPDHALERELSGYGPAALPLREENFDQLSLRADRALKPNAWSENPPPRTRRFIGNVEAEAEAEAVCAVSNVQLVYSARDGVVHTLTGQRRDRLNAAGDGFRIAEREVVLDATLITMPTLALFI